MTPFQLSRNTEVSQLYLRPAILSLSLSLFFFSSNLLHTNQEAPFLSPQSTHPNPDLDLSE